MHSAKTPEWRFRNALCILLSIEREDLLERGIVTPGPHGDGLLSLLRSDPIRFVCKLDEVRLASLWALIESRQ